jgi:hypothetical protein
MHTVLLAADDEAVRSTSQLAGGGQSRGGWSARIRVLRPSKVDNSDDDRIHLATATLAIRTDMANIEAILCEF